MRPFEYVKKPTLVLVLIVAVLPIIARPACANDSRMKDRWGIYGTLFGEPLISLMGLDVAYNATDFLRLNGGVGIFPAGIANLVSLGVGAKFMVPNWEFTPFLGGSFAQWFVPSSYGDIPLYNPGTGAIQPDPNYFYLMIGFDYQAKDGFDIGLGIAYGSFIPAGYGGVPDIFCGKYF